MKIALFVWLLLSSAAFAQTQYAFTNFAGIPAAAGVVDGLGPAAGFSDPRAIAADRAGNLYVAERSSAVIRKIDVNRVVTTIAGSADLRGSADGMRGEARFLLPEGIAVDSSGGVYVADTRNHTIRKIEPSGLVTTLAGRAEDLDGDGWPDGGYQDGVGAEARFNYPTGLAVDLEGNILVADSANHVIRMITPGGVVTTLAGRAGQQQVVNGTLAEARFFWPVRIAVDGQGVIYVADSSVSAAIRMIADGRVTTLSRSFTCSVCGFDYGMTVDPTGNVFVSDPYRIRQITPTGQVTTIAGNDSQIGGNTDGPGSSARFRAPYGLSSDTDGNISVADSGNFIIRKITTGRLVTTIAGTSSYGSADGTGSEARFRLPKALASDSAGNLYVADTENHTIRKVTPDAVVSTLAGAAGQPGSANGTGRNARFNRPRGIAVSPAGDIFVADQQNCTIRKITPAGAVTTLAGAAGQPGTVDGRGLSARFRFPSGLAFDLDGNLYVAEWGGKALRKITPDVEVTTLVQSDGYLGYPALSPAGDIYLTAQDGGLGDILKFSIATGELTLLTGGVNPHQMAVDEDGNIFVADGNAIRRVTPTGEVTTIGGGSAYNQQADGAGSAAKFRESCGIVLDAFGNIFVADENRIVKGTRVTSIARPSLTIMKTSSGVKLAWPESATGFVLERAAGLDVDSWSEDETPTISNGGQTEVLIDTGRSATFYRLRR